MTWGDKFTGKDCDEAWECCVVDDKNRIDCQKLIEMLTSAPAEEGAEGEAAA